MVVLELFAMSMSVLRVGAYPDVVRGVAMVESVPSLRLGPR